MKRSFVPLFIGVITVILPLTMLARTLDPEFRSCMQQVQNTRDQQLLESLQTYNRGLEEALDRRRQAYFDSWDREDDRDQRDAQRAADRAYSREASDLRKAQIERDREIKNNYRTDEKRCRDESRSRSSASRSSSFSRSSLSRSSSSLSRSSSSSSSVRRWCYSNAQCGAGHYCDLSPGVCEDSCDNPRANCIATCVGRCVRI